MDSDTASTGFGRYLQAIRLEKGISLEQVSEATRIGLAILKSIEREKLDDLPAEVFLKGFLRAYSNFIGADGDEVIRRYAAQREVTHKIARSVRPPRMLAEGSLWRLLVALGVLGAVMFSSIYAMSRWQSAGHRGSDQQDAVQSITSPAPDEGPAPAQKKAQPAPAALGSGLVLKISTGADTWIKVIIDQGEAMRYQLKQGEQLQLEAKTAFNLLIGDAGSVSLNLDGKPVPVYGKRGEIVTLDLP